MNYLLLASFVTSFLITESFAQNGPPDYSRSKYSVGKTKTGVTEYKKRNLLQRGAYLVNDYLNGGNSPQQDSYQQSSYQKSSYQKSSSTNVVWVVGGKKYNSKSEAEKAFKKESDKEMTKYYFSNIDNPTYIKRLQWNIAQTQNKTKYTATKEIIQALKEKKLPVSLAIASLDYESLVNPKKENREELIELLTYIVKVERMNPELLFLKGFPLKMLREAGVPASAFPLYSNATTKINFASVTESEQMEVPCTLKYVWSTLIGYDINSKRTFGRYFKLDTLRGSTLVSKYIESAPGCGTMITAEVLYRAGYTIEELKRADIPFADIKVALDKYNLASSPQQFINHFEDAKENVEISEIVSAALPLYHFNDWLEEDLNPEFLMKSYHVPVSSLVSCFPVDTFFLDNIQRDNRDEQIRMVSALIQEGLSPLDVLSSYYNKVGNLNILNDMDIEISPIDDYIIKFGLQTLVDAGYDLENFYAKKASADLLLEKYTIKQLLNAGYLPKDFLISQELGSKENQVGFFLANGATAQQLFYSNYSLKEITSQYSETSEKLDYLLKEGFSDKQALNAGIIDALFAIKNFDIESERFNKLGIGIEEIKELGIDEVDSALTTKKVLERGIFSIDDYINSKKISLLNSLSVKELKGLISKGVRGYNHYYLTEPIIYAIKGFKIDGMNPSNVWSGFHLLGPIVNIYGLKYEELKKDFWLNLNREMGLEGLVLHFSDSAIHGNLGYSKLRIASVRARITVKKKIKAIID